jgi:acetyl esterase/lipase
MTSADLHRSAIASKLKRAVSAGFRSKPTALKNARCGVNVLNMSWRLFFQWILIATISSAAIAFLFLWLYFRGTPDNISRHAIPPASVVSTSTAPQVVRLWPGKPPGSEYWTQQETSIGEGSDRVVRNVVNPTLTAYFPPRDKANGTAVIICPGGGFHTISINNEGADVARYLNSLGITAFVLRYRLTRTNAAFLFVMRYRIRTPSAMDPVLQQMTPLVLSDGQQAMRVVRSQAVQWGLSPRRIGIIGFSAGGFLALDVALHNDAATRPDFIAAIYPLAPKPLQPPAGNIPLFTVCAKDDLFVPPVNNCERVVDIWHGANNPAELYVFNKGGHGFGMLKQNLPIDAWPQLLSIWLQAQGFLPVSQEPAQASIDSKKTPLPGSFANPAYANGTNENVR